VISLEARKLQEQSTVFSLFVVWWREGDSNPPEPEGSTVFETVSHTNDGRLRSVTVGYCRFY
jgi:hypothetical protein